MHGCGWKRLAVILTEVPSVRNQLCTVGAQVEDGEISNCIGCVGGIGNHMSKKKTEKERSLDDFVAQLMAGYRVKTT